MSANYEYIATKLMLLILKTFGLAPLAVKISTGSNLSKNKEWKNVALIRFTPSRFGCIYNVFLVAAQCRILYTAVPLARLEQYPYRSSMTRTIGKTTCVLGNSTLFAIFLILGFRQNAAARLLNRLLSTDGTAFDRNGNSLCDSSREFYLLILLTDIVVWTGIMMTRGSTYSYPAISYFRVIVPSMIIVWFITQYIFVIKLIHDRFRAVNRAIRDRTYRSPITGEVSFNESARMEIATLRRVHANLYEIATEVSKFYSLPILLAISHFCFIFVYSAYFLVVPYIVMVEPPSGMMIAYSALLMIGSMQPIVTLALGITALTAEMKRTADIVNKHLICSSINGCERIELKEFALTLMHRSVRFTACKLFSLDCTLVHSILSMVTTYLIIIVQHQMGSNANTTQHRIRDCTNGASNYSGCPSSTNRSF